MAGSSPTRGTRKGPAAAKNLLRMLVQEVSLSPVEVPSRLTRVQVLWRTGSVSTFTVERPRKEAWSQPSPDLTPAIMELLAAGLTDEEIASEVERRGLRPVGRWRWGAWSVRLIRCRQHLHRPPRQPSPPKRPDGLLSLRGVAIQMGVSLRMVRYWIEKGLLKPAEGGGVGRTRWFNLDAPTLRCLEDASAKMSSRTVRQSSFAQGRAL